MPSLLHDAPLDMADLTVEQTVPRSLVHKRSLENVLLTGIRACADDRFVCVGRLPTAHRFFNDAGRTPTSDILFYTELGRQASLAISHAFLNVSADDAFVFEGSGAALTEHAWTPADAASGAVVVEIRTRDISRRRNDAIHRVVADHTMWVGGQPVFRGTGAWTIQPRALFERLRRASGVRDAAPAALSHLEGEEVRPAWLPHARGSNVVISSPRPATTPGAFTATLLVDDMHPYFFDHPCDHVPGMLLLEGCTQLALAAWAQRPGADLPARVRDYDMTFAHFVERRPLTTLSTDTAGGDHGATFRITIQQGDVVCGAATIGLAVPVFA